MSNTNNQNYIEQHVYQKQNQRARITAWKIQRGGRNMRQLIYLLIYTYAVGFKPTALVKEKE